MKLRAVAMAACLVGTGSYARAYDYVDARGYRHWCQLSCERKGIHVPKPGELKPGELKPGEIKSSELRSDEVKSRRGKVVDENDLAWEPPAGVKWQVVPEEASADMKSLKSRAVAKQNTRP
jgi:hypothetical protein